MGIALGDNSPFHPSEETPCFLEKLNPSGNVYMPFIGVLIGCVSSGVNIVSNQWKFLLLQVLTVSFPF